MSMGYKIIFWGLFLLVFQVDFGEIYMMPSFLGDIVIFYGLRILYKESSNKKICIAGRYAMVLFILSIEADLIAMLSNVSIHDFMSYKEVSTGYICILPVTAVMKILMGYFLLKGSSEILAGRELKLSIKYKKKGIVFLLLSITTAILFSIYIFNISLNYVLISFIILKIGISLWLMFLMRRLSRYYKTK